MYVGVGVVGFVGFYYRVCYRVLKRECYRDFFERVSGPKNKKCGRQKNIYHDRNLKKWKKSSDLCKGKCCLSLIFDKMGAKR